MTDRPLLAYYHSFGCKLNFAETAYVSQILAERGIAEAQRGQTPDLVVVNTCSVTELADKKCRQAIRAFARRWPDAAIVVTGCYAQLKPDSVAALPGVAVVAGTDRKLRLAEYVDAWLATRHPVRHVTPSARDITEFTPSCSAGSRTRWLLKVQDGCDYFCTYCTIPFARGRSRSGSIDSLVAQAREAAAAGAREIVLTGVNVGDFGKGTPYGFIDLIRALDEVEATKLIISSVSRFGSIDEMRKRSIASTSSRARMRSMNP